MNAPIEISSFSISELKRSGNYVYYGVKMTVKNPGPPGRIYIEYAGYNFDGNEVDYGNIATSIGEDATVTLTEQEMVTIAESISIKEWRIKEATIRR